jgi:4,5-DOPA dioxygenase extradiol
LPNNAILCVSAHWFTNGEKVTALKPRTIHDFGGFSQELFDVLPNQTRSPELANYKIILTKEVVLMTIAWVSLNIYIQKPVHL